MGALRGWHIVVLLIVVLLLFGAPRLPELARSIGKSLRILKDETKALSSDDDPKEPTGESGDSTKPSAKDDSHDK
ncbi:Sec-independent protein translocase subunit TatA [Demequina sp. TTPB684]|uniref:Sec-independent protein translocase subunit TatA n=1 Tax=unclassified Demequina TaxID=2620311 RepID=UPI001CF52E70|nr:MULTISPECIES: Sec-independent protein translocase subunit TatA [unclassified Demequina]MCB2413111.1 Sec-independent protein translocase subunit TatA [Demequina sp. TTPB684]UPU89273.1 Sec-independent protein translocase subunit TatA [Demequina sp. TMPB413]